MNMDDILEIIETVDQEYAAPRCQELFFSNINPSKIHPTSYLHLIKEIKKSKNGRFFKDFLTPDKTKLLDNSCGIDILAYYVPFHYGQGRRWGIYIKDTGVALIANRLLTERVILEGAIPLSIQDAEYLAVNKLLLHELGHHAVEVAITFLAKQTSRFPSYYDYKSDKKQNITHQYKEEALCNWNVKKQKKNFVIPVERAEINYYNYIEDFMLKQPSGYRDFLDWPKKKFFDDLCVQPGRMLIHSKTISDAVKEFTKHSRLNMVKRKRNTVPMYLIETNT